MGTNNLCLLCGSKKIFIWTPILSRAIQVTEFSLYNMRNEENLVLSILGQIYAV